MASIKRVLVDQLASRRINREIAFNPDVNVFFGVNGCGKTSLLRIISSALSGRSSDIKNVPFASASVDIEDAWIPNLDGEDFTGDFTRQTLVESAAARAAFSLVRGRATSED